MFCNLNRRFFVTIYSNIFCLQMRAGSFLKKLQIASREESYHEFLPRICKVQFHEETIKIHDSSLFVVSS